MHTVRNGKIFKVKQTGTRYFYLSIRFRRWLPVKAIAVRGKPVAGDEHGKPTEHDDGKGAPDGPQ